ncbi:MAG: ComF family protein [Sphingomicrobium sp.]
MAGRSPIAALWAWALDFALPPRCPGCGTIVDQIHNFCAECWKQLDFLGAGGCASCGMPLQGTDFHTCAVCLARPPRIARARAVVAYDDLSRRLVIKLKYGRKVALAKTMARYMAPLLDQLPPGTVLVPVPLHRRRLWQRGFNQAAILARELSKRAAIPTDARLLKRVKRTPPLKGLNRLQRRRAVAGAFRAGEGAELCGRTVVLVDDVLTTGSTANACARALKRAGAARVDLVSWARVVQPAHLSS